MITADAEYVKRQLDSGLLRSPCLELGVGYGGATLRTLLTSAGIQYFGTDFVPGPEVDFNVDFSGPMDSIREVFANAPAFRTIVALNVLEHTFDPIRVLDNIMELLAPGGSAVLVTPVIWPLHSYPSDFWRPNPDFYFEYCKRRGHALRPERCEYIERGPLLSFQDEKGHFRLPPPSSSSLHTLFSKLIHKLFNTYGRRMFFPSHVALGVVLEKVAAAPRR